MKKTVVKFMAIAAVSAGWMVVAQAQTFVLDGVLMGTVCRYGPYFTRYPSVDAQPVGSACPIRDNFGDIIGRGVVTDE